MTRGPGLAFCRDCGGDRTFRLVGLDRSLDLPTGRPLPEYRACGDCGLIVIALGDMHDSAGFVQTTIARARRRSAHAGAGGAGLGAIADRASTQTWRFDPEDASAHLLEQLWRLYRTWRPDRLPFLSYASQWLPRRLDDWVGDAAGIQRRAGGRSRRRGRVDEESLDAAPVDLAATVGFVAFSSVAIDELLDALAPAGDDRLAILVADVSEDACDDRSRALLRLLADGDRRGDGRLPARRNAAPPDAPGRARAA